ncbi:MAG TPA: hypothetical protein PLZ51_17730 [Aggregatilineales bacterium]|nr:hypothetical protein [Aggregatilineales bacterium]
MAQTINTILPFVLLWIPTTLFFLVMIRRNKNIKQEAKLFWSIIVVVFWFHGALVYAGWGTMAQIWITLFQEKPIQPTP